ncbi:hypothetical protein BH10BAC3_BH10BAC3_14280 [soil metagenome]
MEADFETLKNNVSPEEMKKFLEDIASIDDHSTYDLTCGDKNEEAAEANSKNTWVPILILIVCVLGFAVWSQRRDSRR